MGHNNKRKHVTKFVSCKDLVIGSHPDCQLRWLRSTEHLGCSSKSRVKNQAKVIPGTQDLR